MTAIFKMLFLHQIEKPTGPLETFFSHPEFKALLVFMHMWVYLQLLYNVVQCVLAL